MEGIEFSHMVVMNPNAKTGKQKFASAMPAGIRPMLCTLLSEPFNSPEYLYEVKWDGYRIVAYCDHGKVRLESRGGLDFTAKYPPIVTALQKLKRDVILDGEVVVLNSAGKPDFDALQKINGQQTGVLFYVFDCIWADGRDLRSNSLLDRKSTLANLFPSIDQDIIRVSEVFDDGILLFKETQQLGLEGIVAKKKTSRYLPDTRSKDWFKIPSSIKEEFVIGGWVESKSGRAFRTLLFGAYENGRLVWIGHAGTGYKERSAADILRILQTIEIESSPFSNQVDYEGKVHWVVPRLVANIKYSTKTKSGKIRKPAIFLGFRDDKPAELVTHQTPSINALPNRETSNWPELERIQIRNKEIFTADDCQVAVTNVDTKIWKGITKGDLLSYYARMSRYILPHVRQRPLSLHVKPNGPNVPGLYIKDMEGREPACASVFTSPRKHPKPGKRDVIQYLVCNNSATLLYVINLGCIDVNPWTSSIVHPDFPDYIVIDLDPSVENFAKVRDTAAAAHEFFKSKKLKAFAKTSGKTGIHILIPCSEFNFSDARTLAERICEEIHLSVPGITTTSQSIQERGDKVFVDANQNDYSDTIAGAYSVRPFKIPSVSTPFEWRELKNLNPESFNIHSIHDRVSIKGDLLQGIYDSKIIASNNKILRRL